MYLHLVSFSIIACSLTLGLDRPDETFQIVYNSSMIAPLVDLPRNVDKEVRRNIFYNMSMEDRIKYCNVAKDFAGLDVTATITDAPLKRLPWFNEIMVECRTIPIMYLCKWGSEEKISITMRNNEFFKYPFEVQITKSEPILYSKSIRTRGTAGTEMSLADFLKEIESKNFHSNGIRVSERMTLADLLIIMGSTSFDDKRVNDNRLSRFEEDRAMKLCWAAKRHLQQLADNNNNARHEIPVLQSDRIEPAQIFDFGDEIGDYVALHCPSTPSMYVYFKNPNASTTPDLIQIVLVQND